MDSCPPGTVTVRRRYRWRQVDEGLLAGRAFGDGPDKKTLYVTLGPPAQGAAAVVAHSAALL
jgi:hypothetical protein